MRKAQAGLFQSENFSVAGGFKGDISFLSNLEKGVLKKLDSGHIKNISSHVISEISNSLQSD